MLSCIVDGYDPWERVRSLLDRIHEDLGAQCDVILVASLLLDTPPDSCQRYGSALFGDNFRMLRNDAYSVFHARLRAQELARGDVIFYLSPTVLPAAGTLAALAAALDSDSGATVSSAPLAFLFPGGSSPRLLAHGFAVGKDLRLTPILQGEAAAAPPALDDCCGVVPQPYCCCARGPLYASADSAGTFWQSHLAACARRAGEGLSVGGARAFLHDGAFPVYLGALTHTRALPSPLAATLDALPFPVWLTAYGRYRAGGPDRGLPQGTETAEEVFWGLLASQRPEYLAAAASSRPAPSLGELARQTLLEIAGITWDEARRCARDYLAPHRPGWQSFAQWLAACAPYAETIYAENAPTLRHSLKRSRNLRVALANMLCIATRGLWGGTC